MDNFFVNDKPVFVVAEIGVNHNGSLSLAKEMIDAACEIGVDAVKFQTFSADKLAGKNTPKVKYQISNTAPNESHYEMLKNLELSHENHSVLFDYCKKVGITFISTPYDIESAKFLLDLGVSVIKTSSADLVDLELHHFLSLSCASVIIATGMSTMDEVADVVKIYSSNKNKHIALLHCVSNYPCSYASINMRVMSALANRFKVPVGYSDHSLGTLAAVLAVAGGASIIEKHFTLDKKLPGPDHKASSTPDEFKNLIDDIRNAELIMGSPDKRIQPEEFEMLRTSRKSIVSVRHLSSGHIISAGDLALQRPGTGLKPIHLSELVGRRLIKDVELNHMFDWNDFSL